VEGIRESVWAKWGMERVEGRGVESLRPKSRQTRLEGVSRYSQRAARLCFLEYRPKEPKSAWGADCMGLGWDGMGMNGHRQAKEAVERFSFFLPAKRAEGRVVVLATPMHSWKWEIDMGNGYGKWKRKRMAHH
jgi:hypothetical protein